MNCCDRSSSPPPLTLTLYQDKKSYQSLQRPADLAAVPQPQSCCKLNCQNVTLIGSLAVLALGLTMLTCGMVQEAEPTPSPSEPSFRVTIPGIAITIIGAIATFSSLILLVGVNHSNSETRQIQV